MIYLCNTFSVLMIPPMAVRDRRGLQIERISAAEAGELLRTSPFESAFGHSWSAWHLSRYLRVRVPASRHTIRLEGGDVLLVAEVVNKNRFTARIEGAPKWVFYRVEYSTGGGAPAAVEK